MPLAGQQAGKDAAVTAIRAGRLVDVDAGKVLASQVILIRGGKIDSIVRVARSV